MPDPVLPSRYELMMAALRGDPLPSEDPATPYSLLKRPPRAPDVALPKDQFPGWFAKLMAGVEGATGIPIGPNPEHYETGGEDIQGYQDLGELGSMLLGPLAAGTAMARQGATQTVRAGARRIANPIKAYHGSGADFERFDFSKIGTGEGTQAFGHGGYFGQKKTTGEYYRDALADTTINGQPFDMNQPSHMAAGIVDEMGSHQEALARVREQLQRDPDPFVARVLEVLEQGPTPALQKTGKLYEVDIHATPEELLDWDKPLTEQSPKVQEALNRLWVEKGGTLEGRVHPPFAAHSGATGESAHAALGVTYGPKTGSNAELAKAAAEKLREQGIQGIQFLDAGSRRVGTGTRNFVIFDDQLIDIKNKFGFATLAAAAEWVRQQGGTVQQRGADQ